MTGKAKQMKAYKGKYPHKIREVFTIKDQLYVKTNSVRTLGIAYAICYMERGAKEYPRTGENVFEYCLKHKATATIAKI